MHKKFMLEAIKEARKAIALKEVPVGAIVVLDDKVIGRGHNLVETMNDPTSHAEIIAIKDAARQLGHWRLTNSTLYVTLEPCPMCAGAIVNSRLKRLVFGAYDSKSGAISSLMNLVQDKRLNHFVDVYDGICQKECARLLQEFFRGLRQE